MKKSKSKIENTESLPKLEPSFSFAFSGISLSFVTSERIRSQSFLPTFIPEFDLTIFTDAFEYKTAIEIEINQTIKQSINQSIKQKNQSINHSIIQSINQSINQSVNSSFPFFLSTLQQKRKRRTKRKGRTNRMPYFYSTSTGDSFFDLFHHFFVSLVQTLGDIEETINPLPVRVPCKTLLQKKREKK